MTTTGRLIPWTALFVLMLSGSPQARAAPKVEFSGATGFGVLVAGVTSGRFAISPSGSLSVRGERGFFVARDTVSFLGATGGRFGIHNETTLGGGLFWESVNVSAGLPLAEYSLPICGPRLCGRVYGLAPGASARLDLFGPYLSGGHPDAPAHGRVGEGPTQYRSDLHCQGGECGNSRSRK